MGCMNCKDVLITFLKRERKERDMSQNEFSELLSIPLSTYKGYEYGQASIGPEVIDKISERLDVSYSEMFTVPGEEVRIKPKAAIEVLAKHLGFDIKIQPSINSFFDTELAEKISLLSDRELDLIKLTVDKMISSPAKKKKISV